MGFDQGDSNNHLGQSLPLLGEPSYPFQVPLEARKGEVLGEAGGQGDGMCQSHRLGLGAKQ